MNRPRTKHAVIASCVLACALAGGPATASAADTETTLPVTLTGGHDTDSRDGGRPVVLIAAALGVKPELFREAFRGVTPARDGRPSPEDARRNKQALMRVLGPHGITNDRLDEVSNHYRYRPQKGELWKHTDAKAHAVVANGKVVRIVVTEAGAGYSSPPKATVPGTSALTVTLQFGTDLATNGSIKRIEIAPTP